MQSQAVGGFAHADTMHAVALRPYFETQAGEHACFDPGAGGQSLLTLACRNFAEF